jgi:hypothetical protein
VCEFSEEDLLYGISQHKVKRIYCRFMCSVVFASVFFFKDSSQGSFLSVTKDGLFTTTRSLLIGKYSRAPSSSSTSFLPLQEVHTLRVYYRYFQGTTRFSFSCLIIQFFVYIFFIYF